MGNLNFNTTPEQLSEFLSPAGEIVDVYFATDRDTGRPRGFAFVTFAEESHAAAAILKFNGSELDGRSLNINEAKERPRRQGPPRSDGPRERRPRFEEPSLRGGGGGKVVGGGGGGKVGGGGGGNRSDSSFSNDDVEPYDPHVEKGFDSRDYEGDYEDGVGGGGKNRGRKAKKSKKGSRRGLRARKRSI